MIDYKEYLRYCGFFNNEADELTNYIEINTNIVFENETYRCEVKLNHNECFDTIELLNKTNNEKTKFVEVGTSLLENFKNIKEN